MRLTQLATAAMGSVVALIGFAGAANASATVDLIWIDVSATDAMGNPLCLRPEGIAGGGRDCPRLGTAVSSVATSDNITLAVILTAGPGGSWGAGVSVDYNELLPMMSVAGFQSLTTTIPDHYFPINLGNTTDQSPFIDNINAVASPPVGFGIGLTAGQSAYLGTVTFHKGFIVNGIFEIGVGTNGPGGTDEVLDAAGNVITSTTAFSSAYLINIEGDPPGCTDSQGHYMEIEINALRAGGKTVQAGENKTVDVTAKARILKGTAVSGTTIDTTLTIEAFDGGTTLIGTNSTPVDAVELAVGKGGNGAKLAVGVPQCTAGYIAFVATFFGVDQDNDTCQRTRELRKECR